MTLTHPSRPSDATLSVTKAARLLGVHPNTIRAWSDAGRLRYSRINPRGDRRYRLGDLQRFLAAAVEGAPPDEMAAAPAIGTAGRGPGRRATLSRTLLGGLAGGDPEPWRSEDGRRSTPPEARLWSPDPLDVERRVADLGLLAELAALAGEAAAGVGRDLDATLQAAVRAIRARRGFATAAIWEVVGDECVVRAVDTAEPVHLVPLPRTFGILGEALSDGRSELKPGDARAAAIGAADIACAIPGDGRPWGVLAVAAEPSTRSLDGDLVAAAAEALGAVVRAARATLDVAHRLHRADALRRVAGDIGSRLDLEQILDGLVDHALVLFEGDRAAIFIRSPTGETRLAASRNLSAAYLGAVRDFPAAGLPAAAVAARRPLFSTGYRNDPRGAAIRSAIVQEGYDTIAAAPLLDGGDLLGLLTVYHDRPHLWTAGELDTMDALATQGSVAIKTAQNYAQMATWAAQLQSIQQLGARLNRLTSVREIGLAIATELRQLIDYHNVRVYRQVGMDLMPVAMQGQVGEYVDETPEQLRIAIGQGITGWVAEHKVAQNLPDAAKDPRASTIAGTQEDLDESMLLAPMVFEDQLLGVLVLSKLGLHQFTDDDLRLLVIYASIAAQAMANADGTELLRERSAALERQLRSQQELLQITESILTTLDPTAVLEQIADRLASLVGYDNIAIEVIDRATGALTPLTARGVDAAQFLVPWAPGEVGIATWVVEHNEAVLVLDERSDPRVNHFRDESGTDGSLIIVPLRGRDGATGVLTLERLGVGNTFSEEEFELVKLFAAQVSIALQNAEIHRAVEIRARTDDLTGLFNHGAFREWLADRVARAETFSLVMIDLDEFKTVNDAFGHQAGDRLLAEIGRTIVAAGRDSDSVFRYGGDEFAVILPGADGASALRVAERIRASILAVGSGGTVWAEGGMTISASIGVATYPEDGSGADEILLAADRACFVSKRAGRGRVAAAAEGLALAGEFSLQAPTPVDPPSPLAQAV